MTASPNRIVNYTTKLTAEQSIRELKAILRANGASAVAEFYDPKTAGLVGIEFRTPADWGDQWYRLPVRVEGVLRQLVDRHNGTTPEHYARYIDYPTGPGGGPVRNYHAVPKEMRAQAERTAWRTVRDWIEAQVALTAAGMAEIDRVMMPYALAGDGEQTVYEVFREGQLKALPAGGQG